MLLFCDSFDLYNTLSQKWDGVESGSGGSVASISRTAARNGANGLLIIPATGFHAGVQKNFSSRATYFAGFAFFVSYCNGQDEVVGFNDGATNQCELRINSTGNFQFYRNGTAIGSQSTFALGFGCWHYLEVMVTINSTTGVCQLKVDGSFVINLSGQNTQASGNASASGVAFGSWDFSGNSTYYFDDLVVYDNTGSFNNTFLGDVKVSAQVPSGNGATNNYAQNAASWAASTVEAVGNGIIDSNGALQRVTAITSDAKTGSSAPAWATSVGATTTDNHVTWTLIQKATLSNFNFVNELPPDDNDTYLSDATVNDEDLYTFPALAGAAVNAVVVNLRAEKDDSGTRSVRALAKSGSTTADNGTDFPLSENVYADYQGVFETDPNTGSPWTITGVNAAQFGIKTTA